MAEYRLCDLPGRLQSRITINSESGCWEWQGYKEKRYGYGRLHWQGRVQEIHRVVFSLLVGPIPEGLVLDHVKTRGCISHSCCWPAHLEPVTPGENSRRRDGLEACVRGHKRTPENTNYRPDGRRRCRACARERRAEQYWADPEAARNYQQQWRERRMQDPGWADRYREQSRAYNSRRASRSRSTDGSISIPSLLALPAADEEA